MNLQTLILISVILIFSITILYFWLKKLNIKNQKIIMITSITMSIIIIISLIYIPPLPEELGGGTRYTSKPYSNNKVIEIEAPILELKTNQNKMIEAKKILDESLK